MKDTIGICIAICIIIGQVKAVLLYLACKRQGRCKARTMNVKSIKINGMLMIEVIRVYLFIMSTELDRAYVCGNAYCVGI